MHISWLGKDSIKIQTKPFDKDITIVINPYKVETGTFPRSLAPNIAIFTRGSKDSITLSGEPFILDTAGECEKEGVLMTATHSNDSENTKIRIDSEGLSLGHLGMSKKQLSEKELSVLSGVDILIIPVGGDDSLDAEGASKAISNIEPRIIIPVAYKSDNQPKATSVDTFLKELGVPGDKEGNKVIIKKKVLPQEDIRVVILEKE